MAWLRLDDGYDSHPKILQLTETERWRWTRVLLHCARHRTQGSITKPVLTDIGLGRVIPKLLHIGLLDQTDDNSSTYTVHDWDDFNPKDPTNADRQRRHRNALRNTQRNGEVTPEVTESDTDPALQNRDSRAGTRARTRPVLERDKSLSTDVTPENVTGADEQTYINAFHQAITEDVDQARRDAWAARAQAPDIRSPQAFIAAGMRTGGWPDPAPSEQRPVTVNGSAPDDAGCPSCGVGGGVHAADCDQAVDAGASSELDSFGLPFGRYQPLGDKVVDAEGNELRIESVRPELERGDNRTEEQ